VIIERFQRTFKERLYRAMTARKTYKYLNLIPLVINAYNRSVHSTLGIAPLHVDKSNELQLLLRQYSVRKKQISRKPREDLSIGDTVKISKSQQPFEKSFRGYWRNEPFSVSKIRQGFSNKAYIIKDQSGEPIQGAFYREQLLRVPPAVVTSSK